MSVFFTRRGKAPDYTPVPKDNFADNDWATIIWACQTKNVPESWAVGSQKPMTINGKDYPIDIIGLGHDDYADGSGKAPITFQMNRVYDTNYTIDADATKNTCGWHNSDMRNTHLPSIMALMPQEVQAGIREVNKKTSSGGLSNITIKTTADKLFLLSEVEITGGTERSAVGEGSKYAYYTSTTRRKKKKLNGSGYGWVTRSPHSNEDTLFVYITADGKTGPFGIQSTYAGVAFAFCF